MNEKAAHHDVTAPATGHVVLQKKRASRVHKKRLKTEAATAGEAIEKMLHEKKISSKINYDVLKGAPAIRYSNHDLSASCLAMQCFM